MYAILEDGFINDNRTFKISSIILKDMKFLKREYRSSYTHGKFIEHHIEKESKAILNDKNIIVTNSYVYGHEGELSFVYLAYGYKYLDDSIKFSKKDLQLIESLKGINKFNL